MAAIRNTRSKTDDTAREGAPVGMGERVTVIALLAMAAALAFVRFHLLPRQQAPAPLAFHLRNPMLDAKPGERALFFPKSRPHNRSCSVVRDEGVVLRPHKGPRTIGQIIGLRTSLPYLACDIRAARGGESPCGGEVSDVVLYALNYFGMPHDTDVRVEMIRPRWMRWGERELVVYEVVMERYGTLGGTWTTFVAEESPVAGLVKWTSMLPHQSEVHYREIFGGAR